MGHPQRHFSVDQQCLIPQDPAGLVTPHLRVIKSAPRGFIVSMEPGLLTWASITASMSGQIMGGQFTVVKSPTERLLLFMFLRMVRN